MAAGGWLNPPSANTICASQITGNHDDLRPAQTPPPFDPAAGLRLHPTRRVFRYLRGPRPRMSVRRCGGRRHAVKRIRRNRARGMVPHGGRAAVCDVGPGRIRGDAESRPRDHLDYGW